MKNVFAVLLLSAACAAQCAPQNNQTVCQGPVIVVAPPANTLQSGIILIDLSLPTPVPTPNQYILSIANGTLVESDNGHDYHTLVGPQGPPGTAGASGNAATVSIGQTFTGPPGSSATVTNGGTQNAAVLNFTIPQGAQGATGPPGVVVGNTLTLTVTCPKGTGTIQQGWATKNCKAVITAIQ